MSAKKRATRTGPTFRTELKRRANDLGVPSEDLDRALIIGQVAGLLIKEGALKGKLAHKGAAILRLVDHSQRLSRDLDSADIRGQRVTARAIDRALSTAEAKKVVLKVTPNRPGQNSISFLVECRRFAGGTTLPITITINWSEPFILPVVMGDYLLPNGTPIKVPIMQAVERAAEKVRAFLTRGEAADAYDLWWYWNRVLTTIDREKLPSLIRRKLVSSARRIPGADDLHVRFDEMRASAHDEWTTGQGLVLSGRKPDWKDVDAALLKSKARTPGKT
ncbi:MAG TPA: nucleotidyl transferase AbiEii/AbiGii toxin family protein [Candidatus Limnocylindria bacterium]|nr:nucleotidyl transferase AbiEii/AbiGii toxin family protein [Candidatus Limnocylindria bacterium]